MVLQISPVLLVSNKEVRIGWQPIKSGDSKLLICAVVCLQCHVDFGVGLSPAILLHYQPCIAFILFIFSARIVRAEACSELEVLCLSEFSFICVLVDLF